MNYLVLYDISTKKFRKTIPTYLKKEGMHRLQKSVFLGKLTPIQKNRISHFFNQVIHNENLNYIVIIPLNNYSIKHMQQYGLQKDIDLFLNKKIVIFV